MKKEIISCDICGSEEKITSDIGVHVIMTTEQDEGRPVPNYFEQFKLDLCEKCQLRRLTGEAVFGKGSQGYNEYYFK